MEIEIEWTSGWKSGRQGIPAANDRYFFDDYKNGASTVMLSEVFAAFGWVLESLQSIFK